MTQPRFHLAANYAGRITRSMWAQPKIDGVRAVIGPFGPAGDLAAMSRNWKPLQGCEHILAELAERGVGEVLDGEIYAGDWSRTISAIRGRAVGAVFYAFDLIPWRIWFGRERTDPLAKRDAQLGQAVAGMCHVKHVASTEVRTDDDVQRAARRFVREGYEGIVLKDPASRYAFGSRGCGWTKLKPAPTDDCTLLSIDLDAPAIQVLTPAGAEQWVYHGLTSDLWEQIADAGPGCLVEVKHLGKSKLHGQLKSAVAMRVRLDARL